MSTSQLTHTPVHKDRYLVNYKPPRPYLCGLNTTKPEREQAVIAWMQKNQINQQFYEFVERIGPSTFKRDNGEQFTLDNFGYTAEAWELFLSGWETPHDAA